LRLVDAVIVNTATHGPEQREPSAAAWLKRMFPGPVLEATPCPEGDTTWIKDARLVAYAGIANPTRFFAMLERLGGRLTETLVFPDHHGYTEADAERLLGMGVRRQAQLVTTEKDWVRLLGHAGRRGKLRENSRTLRIRLTLDERDAGRLMTLIQTALRSEQAPSHPRLRQPGQG
jgi:tetraacyldisaccharide 4'-kinase